MPTTASRPCPWAGMLLSGALVSPPLGGGVGSGKSEKHAGPLGFCGPERRDGRVRSHIPARECLAHTGPGLGQRVAVGVGEAFIQGARGLLFHRGLEAPEGRVWGKWAGDRAGRGAGAKGPERQMSPISVLPLAGLRQLGTSQSGRTGWGTRPLKGRTGLKTPSSSQLGIVCKGGSRSSGDTM